MVVVVVLPWVPATASTSRPGSGIEHVLDRLIAARQRIADHDLVAVA
jgi:hypothetical protein